MDAINIFLLILLALGVIGNNVSISVSVAILLLLRLVHLERILPFFESYGIQIGLVILTIGVLAPIGSGKIGLQQMLLTMKNPTAILGFVIGIIVSYLGGRGVNFLSSTPILVTGIMLGTIAGVAFLKGVPVGPLIAAGGVAVILQLFHVK